MPRLSSTERDEVKTWFARLDASSKVWDGLRGERRQFQDALANKFPIVVPGVPNDSTMSGAYSYVPDQVNFNITSRIIAYIKSKATDVSPEIRISGMRDEDIQTSAMNEHLLSRVMETGRAPEAVRSGIDDMATLGPLIVWFGVDTYTIDHRRLAGIQTTSADLVAQASQGGDVHPLPGMDMQEVAGVARNVYTSETFSLTEFQKANLLRLADEADAMWKASQEDAKKPQQVLQPRKIWYRATPYGRSCLSDSMVWDNQDARFMARLIVFSPEQFQAWEPFKKRARNGVEPVSLTPDSGHEHIDVPMYDDEARADKPLNYCHPVWELWDRFEVKTHYLTQNYDGYLEEDSTYPYLGPDGQPVWDDFFPCEWVVPYKHNVPNATQPIGVPLISYFWPQQIETIKLRSAGIAAAKRSARFYELGGELDPDEKAAIEAGVDGTTIQRSEDLKPQVPMVRLVEMGSAPPDYYRYASITEQDAYAMAAVTPIQIRGDSTAPTAAQEQMAVSGSGAVQGDVLSQIETMYGRMARKTADLIRLFFTPQHAARYIGQKYVTPLVDQNGNVVQPAPFDLWKAESLEGVDIVASFTTKGHGDDPVAIKQLMDAIALCFNAKDGAGLQIKDPKPLLDVLFRRMGLGAVPDYKPTQSEMMVRAIQNALMQRGQGAPPAKGPPSQGSDGRRAMGPGGDRGPAPVPGRKGRHQAPPGPGDMVSNRVLRQGVS